MNWLGWQPPLPSYRILRRVSLPHEICMRPNFRNLAQVRVLQYHKKRFLWIFMTPELPACLQELSEEIEDYTQRFNTEDQLEWNLVLQEVAAFVEVTHPSRCKVTTFNVLCFIIHHAFYRLTVESSYWYWALMQNITSPDWHPCKSCFCTGSALALCCFPFRQIQWSFWMTTILSSSPAIGCRREVCLRWNKAWWSGSSSLQMH